MMTPSRGRLLVRPVRTPPTLTGGRIELTEKTRDEWTWGQMEVMSVGGPALCDDDSCERTHQSVVFHPRKAGERCHYSRFSPGDWVLIKPRSASATHQAGLYVCNQDDVLAILQD